MSSDLKFRRLAGSRQAVIDTFAGLVQAVGLPEPLWIATACPVEGLHCDKKFLSGLDSDHNGRVRVEELREAVRWTAKLLADHGGVNSGSETLQLNALSKEGERFKGIASLILETIGAPARDAISLEQVRKAQDVFRERGLAGEGAVSLERLAGHPVLETAKLLLPAMTPHANRYGQASFTADNLSAFREEWTKAGEHLSRRNAVFTWGDGSLAIAGDILALDAPVRDFFALCRLARVGAGAAAKWNVFTGEGGPEAWVRALPVAPPRHEVELRRSELVDGPHRAALERIFIAAKTAVISASQWDELTARAQAVADWQAAVESSPVLQLRLKYPDLDLQALDELEKLRASDESIAGKVKSIDELESLILRQRWLLGFANNFIAMPHLYMPEKSALFEWGRLVIAGRELRFSVLVTDRAAHIKQVDEGTMFVAYARVQEKSGGGEFEIAAPLTAGTSNGVAVGKRGVFYDRDGKEYDAVIVHVVRHPVSLWEAAISPYTRIGKFITSKIESWASSGEKTLDSRLETGYQSAASAKAPAEPVAGGGAGAMAGAGLALAAIGSSFAFIANQLKSMTLLDLVNVVMGLVLIISGPAALLGWLKLRRRNLAIVLEGSGWALNDRLLLSRELGYVFTRRPRPPAGSEITGDALSGPLRDYIAKTPNELRVSPFGAGVRAFWIILALAVILLWQYRSVIWPGK
ncbi:MAG: hypothetical protein GMKNLPBB_01456 [Myxococcota bacterium]|nr:hypothetical protein [Myxococcota bacterium]